MRTCFSVTVGQSALPANYAVEVAQLAQSQKLTSGAFAAPDTVVGIGTLTVAVGSEAFNIEITDQNNTLAGIRGAINDALENTGVSATIVSADAGSYLILSGEKTGVANSMVITQAGGDGGLSALEYDPGNGLNSMSQDNCCPGRVGTDRRTRHRKCKQCNRRRHRRRHDRIVSRKSRIH